MKTHFKKMRFEPIMDGRNLKPAWKIIANNPVINDYPDEVVGVVQWTSIGAYCFLPAANSYFSLEGMKVITKFMEQL